MKQIHERVTNSLRTEWQECTTIPILMSGREIAPCQCWCATVRYAVLLPQDRELYIHTESMESAYTSKNHVSFLPVHEGLILNRVV